MAARNSSRPLDLNLVKVFVAVYETASVTLAAERMFMTQPSVSYSLLKLRTALRDPLFNRSADGMQPTALAKEVYDSFRQAIANVEDGLQAAQAFDPATSTRRFRVSMSDLGAMIFVPPLMTALTGQAPRVELDVVELAVEEIPNQLASGQIDAAIGNLPSINALTQNEFLFHESYSCLMRSRHPLAARRQKTISRRAYEDARHVYVSSRSSGQRIVEQRLRELGIKRKITLQIQHFTALMTTVATSDLVATLPTVVAVRFAAYPGLVALPLSIDFPKLDMRLHWSAQREGNAALQWFLTTAKAALTAHFA